MGGKPVKPADPIACPGCPECEFCDIFDDADCETFLNNEFITQAGTASPVAHQNHWEFDFKDALKFVFSDCKEKTGKDTSALLPFCNMSLSRDECTENRKLDGRDVELVSKPYEDDCVSALCTQGGSTQFVDRFDTNMFKTEDCTGGDIRKYLDKIQEYTTDKTNASNNTIISKEKLKVNDMKFYNKWNDAWDNDKSAAQQAVLVDKNTCLIALRNTKCKINNDGTTTELLGIGKNNCTAQRGAWTSVENTGTHVESNLARCNKHLAIAEDTLATKKNTMRHLRALHVMRGDIRDCNNRASCYWDDYACVEEYSDVWDKPCNPHTGIQRRTFTKRDPNSTCDPQHSEQNCNVDCIQTQDVLTDNQTICNTTTGRRLVSRLSPYQQRWHGGKECKPAEEYEDCDVDCEGTWSGWTCDESTGIQTRIYNVTVNHKNNGVKCPSTPEQKVCDVDCEGTWSGWTCDESTGIQTRIYNVTVNHKNNGVKCPSPEQKVCDVDCEGTWGNWTGCNCGSTNETRSWTTTVTRRNNGNQCDGGGTQSRSCTDELSILEVLAVDVEYGTGKTGAAYVGCQNKTKKGKKCANWNNVELTVNKDGFKIKPFSKWAGTVHNKMYHNKMYDSSVHNYCRNPRPFNNLNTSSASQNNEFLDTIWCYVKNGTRYTPETCNLLN